MILKFYSVGQTKWTIHATVDVRPSHVSIYLPMPVYHTERVHLTTCAQHNALHARVARVPMRQLILDCHLAVAGTPTVLEPCRPIGYTITHVS